MKRPLTFQLSPRNNLQKAMTGDGPDPRLQLDGILVIDETGIEKSERPVYVCKAELRIALLEAMQNGDVRILKSDPALIDTGRIRLGAMCALYPNYRAEAAEEDGLTIAGGETFRKAVSLNEYGEESEEIVKGAYRSYATGGRDARDPNEVMREAARYLDNLVRQQDEEK